MKKVFLILGFLLIAGNAQAGLSAIELNRMCIESKNPVEQGFCLGFIGGFLGYHETIQVHLPAINTCQPKTLTTGELKNIFAKYLNQHPQEAYKNPISVLFLSIKEAWPCEKNN